MESHFICGRWLRVVEMIVVVTILMTTVPSNCQRQPPHILFIVADDLGWNDVDWRDPQLYTPTLTRYASQGVILNNSYVQPVCSPSRSAFMSGMFPYHTGLQHDVIKMKGNASLPVNLITLPQALRSQGYISHMVGKWHLGYCKWDYTPTFRGFDSFMGFYGGVEDYYTHMSRHGKMDGLDFRKDRDPDKEDNGTYSVYAFEERVMEIVAKHDMTKPLFLYLPFQSVHEPLQVPKMYEDMYCSKIKNATRRTKCGMIAVMDEAIKNITGLMDTRGFFDNMLMIFTTDNGAPVWAGGNNWPLRGAKATLWEGGTRATAFVYSKNLLRNPGTVYNGMMHAVDWYPTILNVAGGMPPRSVDGINLWEAIADGEPSPRMEFVYNIDDLEKFHAAIRMGDWKLIAGSAGSWNDWYPPEWEGEGEVENEVEGEWEDDSVDSSRSDLVFKPEEFRLYNLKDDPTEHNDIKDMYPDVLAKMKARLSELHAEMVPAQDPPSNPASDPSKSGGVWSPGWC